MNADDVIAAMDEIEARTREIASAITSLGELMPPGMAVTVSHPLGGPAVVMVTYPNGETSLKQFQRQREHIH